MNTEAAFQIISIEERPTGIFVRMKTPLGTKLVGPFEDKHTAETKMTAFITSFEKKIIQKTPGGVEKAEMASC